MTQSQQFVPADLNDIGHAVDLIDAAFEDFLSDPAEANEALATVPLRALVMVSALALETVKTLSPEMYQALVEKHKLVPQDAQA